jgi:hydroxymethylpyrimidine/phosphomethylpyrimidine kinase / thiaminase
VPPLKFNHKTSFFFNGISVLIGDYYQLLMALIACLLGYGEVGLWLKREAAKENSWVKLDGNPYKKWIDDYSGKDYQEAVRKGIGMRSFMSFTRIPLLMRYGFWATIEKIETIVIEQNPSPEMLKTWTSIWEKTIEMERRFWDMAIELQ